MSFLAWAFGLAALAVGFPIFFHLIRRTPKGRQEFSSLLFLQPSPPRLTSRSRINNWLLLLLRGLIIALLAIAFMRPFLRENVALTSAEIPSRKIAILLDTSASMQAGNSWPDALRKVERIVRRADQSDDLALITFDRSVNTIVDFEAEGSSVPREKASLIRAALGRLQPSWYQTDLANALMTVADSMDIQNEIDANQSVLQIILVSDMQSGSRVDALQSFQWPQAVRVDVRTVNSGVTSNASVRILNNKEMVATENRERIRVANDGLPGEDQFDVRWSSAAGNLDGKETVPFYVPAGSSRVLQMERKSDQAQADRLVLTGDQAPFDNVFYTLPNVRQQVPVLYFGDDEPDDANGLRYFLNNALKDNAWRTIKIEALPSSTNLNSDELQTLDARCAIVSRALDAGSLDILQNLLDKRGTLLVVGNHRPILESLASLTGNLKILDSPTTDGQVRNQYSLLADIDFQHPLFAPFASPKYNDFTGIHFWNHLRIDQDSDALNGGNASVIAAFDDRSPALIEIRTRPGKILILTSSWSPGDSELAMSSKFVPLINLMVDQAGTPWLRGERGLVGNPIPTNVFDDGSADSIVRPDNQVIELDSDSEFYRETDMPGIYHLRKGNADVPFAVNLEPAESDLSIMPMERLKMHQVQLGSHGTQVQRLEKMQLLKDKQLENRQKIWKWLIVAALAFLVVETLLSGIAARKVDALPEASGSS